MPKVEKKKKITNVMTISGPQSSQVSGCELLLLPYDTITHLIHGVTVQVQNKYKNIASRC
jgi:hypothetical protein